MGRKGFTLIELLITIGIVGALATATVIVLNPAELLRKSRDAKRMAELQTLNRSLMLANLESLNLGNASTVYVSMPDSSATCANLGLPGLPSGWSYACKPIATFRKTDGTGWVPVNFDQLSTRAISTLPIDPVNSAGSGLFYTYTVGSWELNAVLESNKHGETASKDGGDSLAFELGSDLKLNLMRRSSFEFSDFNVTTTKAGQPMWFKHTGTGVPSIVSDAEGDYMRASGYVWYEWQENIPFNPDALYKISCRVRQVSDPVSGGKNIYCGLSGVAADKTTYINATGVNAFSSQHYIAACGAQTLVSGAGYTTFTGYLRGRGTPAGGCAPNQNSPARMYPGVEYIRPMFILNYDVGNGVADIDMEIVEILSS